MIWNLPRFKTQAAGTGSNGLLSWLTETQLNKVEKIPRQNVMEKKSKKKGNKHVDVD